ncbi:DUF4907 domain-containing protein [Joostella sp. CR20]|uniref:DUF4907 domain-containing protein n=1 Tax=Joostella sp. CR20 TaxID=2804312 RepID=UPI00313CB491
MDTEIINVEDGYGYEIYYKEKLLIKQKYIPAIATQKSFKTKQDAQKVALLVAQKIKKKQKPVVQITELDSLNIQRN